MTGTYGRAPCGYNLIQNNTVSNNITLHYYAIPDMRGHANRYSPHYAYGNTVINNFIGVELVANYQYTHINNNTGPWKEKFFNVTLIPLSLEIKLQSPKNLSIN